MLSCALPNNAFVCALARLRRRLRSYVVDAAAGERLEESRATLERVRR